MSHNYDLIIIGAGPAGMTSALYAARHGLKFTIIGESVGGAANLAPEIGSYPGCGKMPGYDLMQLFKRNLDEQSVRITEDKVSSVGKSGNEFIVEGAKADYRARALIIATGRRDTKLNVPGEDKLFGKGLSYCTVCDGPMFKNKEVVVIGGGRSGLLSTLFVLKMMKRIHVIEKSSHLGGPALTREIETMRDAVSNAKNVNILTGTKVLEIVGDQKVSGVKVMQKNGQVKTMPVDAVFVEVGYTPNSDIFKDLVKMNSLGEIVIDKNCHTSVPGVYAAGDVTDIISKQIVTSCGEGANALIQASNYIAEMKKR